LGTKYRVFTGSADNPTLVAVYEGTPSGLTLRSGSSDSRWRGAAERHAIKLANLKSSKIYVNKEVSGKNYLPSMIAERAAFVRKTRAGILGQKGETDFALAMAGDTRGSFGKLSPIKAVNLYSRRISPEGTSILARNLSTHTVDVAARQLKSKGEKLILENEMIERERRKLLKKGDDLTEDDVKTFNTKITVLENKYSKYSKEVDTFNTNVENIKKSPAFSRSRLNVRQKDSFYRVPKQLEEQVRRASEVSNVPRLFKPTGRETRFETPGEFKARVKKPLFDFEPAPEPPPYATPKEIAFATGRGAASGSGIGATVGSVFFGVGAIPGAALGGAFGGAAEGFGTFIYPVAYRGSEFIQEEAIGKRYKEFEEKTKGRALTKDELRTLSALNLGAGELSPKKRAEYSHLLATQFMIGSEILVGLGAERVGSKAISKLAVKGGAALGYVGKTGVKTTPVDDDFLFRGVSKGKGKYVQFYEIGGKKIKGKVVDVPADMFSLGAGKKVGRNVIFAMDDKLVSAFPTKKAYKVDFVFDDLIPTVEFLPDDITLISYNVPGKVSVVKPTKIVGFEAGRIGFGRTSRDYFSAGKSIYAPETGGFSFISEGGKRIVGKEPALSVFLDDFSYGGGKSTKKFEVLFDDSFFVGRGKDFGRFATKTDKGMDITVGFADDFVLFSGATPPSRIKSGLGVASTTGGKSPIFSMEDVLRLEGGGTIPKQVSFDDLMRELSVSKAVASKKAALAKTAKEVAKGVSAKTETAGRIGGFPGLFSKTKQRDSVGISFLEYEVPRVAKASKQSDLFLFGTMPVSAIGVKQKNELIMRELGVVKPKSKQSQREKEKLKELFGFGVGVSTATAQKQKTAESVLFGTIPVSATATAEKARLSEIGLFQGGTVGSIPPVEPIPPPPITVPLFLPKDYEPKKKKFVKKVKKKQGYVPMVKHRGKWIKASKNVLPLKAALSKGARTVDKYTQQSFTLRKSKKKPLPIVDDSWFGGLKRKFRRKGRVFIEKKKFAIDSFEEVKGIPFEGLKAKKRYAKMRKGVFF